LIFEPNIGNSVFLGFNDTQGIMLCGYESGFSKADEASSQLNEQKRNGVPHVFSNKAAEYGDVANGWKYDRRIIHWFDLFGHKLSQIDTGGDFEKCIVQTNWCGTQNNNIDGNYWEKLLSHDSIDNFIAHIEMFKPRLILFFGSQIVKILQSEKVLPQFVQIMGEITEPLRYCKKPFHGKAFNVGFQGFKHCKLVCFPHPSGSHGLNDDYIQLFAEEIGTLVQEFKDFKGVQ